LDTASHYFQLESLKHSFSGAFAHLEEGFEQLSRFAEQVK